MTSLKDYFAKEYDVPEISSLSRSTAAVPCTSDSDPIIIETVTDLLVLNPDALFSAAFAIYPVISQ